MAGLFFSSLSLFAAESQQEKGRYDFAQTYLGFENLNYEYDSLTAGDSRKEDILTAFTLGGLHYWGHADFYLSFPLNSLGDDERFSPKGVETFFRYFPWQLNNKQARPFLGAGFGFASYENQEPREKFPRTAKVVTPLQLGLSYRIDPLILDVGISHTPNSELVYYRTETETQELDWEDNSYFLGLKAVFDTTRGTDIRKNQPLERGFYAYGGIGFSSAWQWGAPNSQYVEKQSPYLDVAENPFLFYEWTLGFIAKRKTNVGWRSMLQLAYRPMEKEARAFGTQHSYKRTAYSLDFLESYGDFHGFVPYVGVSWNIDRLEFMTNEDGGERVREEHRHFGLVGGWDILPRLDSRWFLRTNLRWYAHTDLNYQGQRVSFPNFEFNFIQLILRFN